MSIRGGQRGWLVAAVLALGPPSWAQSSGLRDAIRLHSPDAQTQAQGELAACDLADCPHKDRLGLLTGYLLLSDGQAALALQVLQSHPAPPGLEPWHAFYLGQAAFYTRQYAAAVSHFERARKAAPASLEPRVVPRLGEALLAAGRPKQALPWLDKALLRGATAELLWARARARELTKDTAGARADLQQLAIAHPTHPLGRGAIEALEAGKGGAALSFADRLRRARAFLDANDAPLAERELQIIEAQKLATAAASQLQVSFLRAQVAYNAGREVEAEALLDLVAKGPRSMAAEAAWTRARRALRSADRARAHALMLAVVKDFPDERVAPEALYLAGWLDLHEGRFDDAVARYTQFDAQFGRSAKADEALWFRALALLRKEDYATARTTLEQLVTRFPKSSLVPQASYWSIRSLQLLGGPKDELHRRYLALMGRFPGTFYGLMAQVRLGELGKATPSPFPASPQAAVSEAPRALAGAQSLFEVGLLRDARAEIDAQLSAVRNAKAALEFGQALQRVGEYGPAYRLAARHLWGATYGAKQPEAIALMFPRAYRTTVEREAMTSSVPAHFVWAIMRRESAFRPEVASSADARGLMQIIPPTATRIAAQLGSPPPAPDALFAPEVSIRYGAWYLARLHERFGHPALAAAAYNAGPSPVLRWVEEKGTLPLDLFVELIPFKETRGYVKSVMADYHLYQALYSEQGWAAPVMTLPSPRPSGVDF
jgi:soluble lytic murein transglycosylase